MNPRRILAILLIVLRVLALAYRGFSYTREKKEAHIGDLNLTFEKKEQVEVPVWAGVVAIGVGVALLMVRGRS